MVSQIPENEMSKLISKLGWWHLLEPIYNKPVLFLGWKCWVLLIVGPWKGTVVIKIMFCVLSQSINIFPWQRKIDLIFFLGVPDFPGCREIWKFLARLNYCSYLYVLSFLQVLLIAAAISGFLSLDGLVVKHYLEIHKITYPGNCFVISADMFAMFNHLSTLRV